MSVGRVLGTLTLVLPVLLLLPLAARSAPQGPPTAGSGCDRAVYESRDLRICAALDRQGRPGLLLTNLDDDGNRLVPATAEEPSPRWTPPAVPAAPTAREDEREAGVAPEATVEEPPSVRVVVRSAGDERPAGDGEVEVTTRGEGTTIVINVNPPAPERPAPIVVPVGGIALVGGLPGPFRYPEHHHFLGYGHSTASPGLFSGLGLNPSNGYGLSNGTPCGRGFDCMFGPEKPHP